MPIKSAAIFNEEQQTLRKYPPSDAPNCPLIRHFNPSHPQGSP
jgi:hypothetical protein